jgi:ribonucleoside-diphosphate reductase alpha chain
LKLTKNAEDLLKRRYYIEGETSWKQLSTRVAREIAKNEINKEEYTDEFFNMIYNLDMLPNSPALMNAGTEIGYLSACNVLPVEDSMEGIFESVKNSAIIQKNGGGIGSAFSRLRPRNDVVNSTGKYSSGVISFMRVFDSATDVVKQGGKRRGAFCAS